MEKITNQQIYSSWRHQSECNTHIKTQTFLIGSSAQPKQIKKLYIDSNACVLSMLSASMYFDHLRIFKKKKNLMNA